MADLSITVASVLKGTGAVIAEGIAGATLTAGELLYQDTANGNVMKGVDADLSALAATIAGVALHGALTGQPIAYLLGGQYVVGATLVPGKIYVGSATGGGLIAPASDLTTGWYTSIFGVAISTTVMQVQIINSGISN